MRRTVVAGELRTGGGRGAPPPGARGVSQPWGHQPGAGSGVLWETLRGVVAERAGQSGRASLDVVDVGGGTGGFAVPLASLGHSVTVIDPSPDSLAAAQRRAAEAGVPLRAVQGDVSDLAAVTEGSGAGGPGADLVLCHSVLEYVDSPGAAMTAIAAILRPGGVVSVLAASAVAAVIHRVLAGRFDEARRLIAAVPVPSAEAAEAGAGEQADARDQDLPAVPDGMPRRFTLPAVVGLIERAGLRPGPGHGVRVFTDLVPASLTDADPGAAGALAALEEAASAHPAFRGLATQFHVLGFR
jgi:S-adenosylmethionine-dependent methyltransferase